jgi:hypothetical protein
MRMVAGGMGLILLALLLMGCGGGDDQALPVLQGNIIQGYVYYPDLTRAAGGPTEAKIARSLVDGQFPVGGAVVSLLGTNASAATTAKGFFQLAVPAYGTYTLRASHPSFRDPVFVTVEVTGELTQVDSGMGVGFYIMAGINDYLYTYDLQGPLNDVAGMVATVPMFLGRTTVLKDNAATKAGIKAAFDQAAQRMRKEDFLFFYFSGHGGRDFRTDYICPQDTLTGSFENDITDVELRTWVEALPDPTRVIVILDTCYSGSFIDGLESRASAKRSPAAGATLRSLSKTGCTVLAASAREQYSWEGSDYVGVVRGYFSKNLMIGLSSERNIADIDRDRQITARELFDYAYPRTVADTQNYQVQEPQFQEGANPVIARY